MRRAALAFAAALVAAVVCASVPDAGPPPSAFGRTVASVGWIADGPVDPRTVGALIGIVAGRPLSEAETGDTIRDLYGTLLFSEVAVDATVLDDGRVSVLVYLRRAFRVRSISFRGGGGLSGEDMRRTLDSAG